MDEHYARRLRAWLRAAPEETPSGTADEREWLRQIPPPQPDSDEARPQADPSVRGHLPQPAADDAWAAVVIPAPRPSRENGCRMSEAEARSRRNHPSGRLRRDDEAEQGSRRNRDEARPMSEAEAEQWSRRNRDEPCSEAEAEARSRWNHPSNWHRRRREAEDRRRDEPGSR